MSRRKCPEHPTPGEVWEKQRISYFVTTPEYRELYDIAGEPVVFEWRIFPAHTTMQLLQEVKTMMNIEIRVQPQDFKDRIIFMSTYNDITGHRNTVETSVYTIHHVYLLIPVIFLQGAGHVSAPEMRKRCVGSSLTNQTANGTVQQKP